MNNKELTIALASDHAGFDLKTSVAKELSEKYNVVDLGCDNSQISVDYPDFAKKLAEKIIKKEADFGILICGSGIGVSIAANRFKEIRAALCHNQKTSELARKHNNANVLCLGARMIEKEIAIDAVNVFLNTEFEGGRHIARVEKL